MKRFSILSIAFVAVIGLSFASPAFAEHNNGQGGDDCEEAPCGPPGNPGGQGGNGGNGGNGGQGGNQGQQQGQIGINHQGQAQGIFDSGNSQSNSSAAAAAAAASDQDQSQSQLGINEQDQGQGQGQGQFGFVDTDLTVEGDTTTIDNDFPVNTAAPVFAGNCSQGVSAQTASFGGSIATGNSVCDFIAVAGAYIAGGDRSEAFRVLGKAEKAADWRFFFSRIRMTITLGLL